MWASAFCTAHLDARGFLQGACVNHRADAAAALRARRTRCWSSPHIYSAYPGPIAYRRVRKPQSETSRCAPGCTARDPLCPRGVTTCSPAQKAPALAGSTFFFCRRHARAAPSRLCRRRKRLMRNCKSSSRGQHHITTALVACYLLTFGATVRECVARERKSGLDAHAAPPPPLAAQPPQHLAYPPPARVNESGPKPAVHARPAPGGPEQPPVTRHAASRVSRAG